MSIEKTLPDLYNTNEDSNNAKLLNIFEDELNSLNQQLELVQLYQDIDKAKGKTLDRIGQNVQLQRNGWNDAQYRVYLKTKIITNLSGGEIETINEVMQVILGENYEGIKEGWQSDAYDNEPALVIIRYIHDAVENGVDLPEKKKLDGNVELDGEYNLSGYGDYVYDTQNLDYAKAAAKKIIAGGIRISYETMEKIA